MSSRVDPGRRSRLVSDPAQDLQLLFADLHNHSLLSDGRGDPELAFQQMRDAGLDVAALTDHASIPRERLKTLGLHQYPDATALAIGRLAPRSLDDFSWKRTAELADAHDAPGEFTALRGFEWTEPWLGHVNVWFSDGFLPVTTPGRLSGLQDFLADQEPSALFGYNHPGRGPGRLEGFELPQDRPGLGRRMVALEAFNRSLDFLFEGYNRSGRSPIADCLDAGWRPGLIGSSDEHGRSYGLVGKGRAGLWALAHTRQGVREALLSRRCYATREVGLRLDATLDGVSMGAALDRPDGSRTGSRRVEMAVDCAGSTYQGHLVELQLITGSNAPVDDGGVRVVNHCTATVGEVTRVQVEIPDDARWLVLRVADPARPAGVPAPAGHPADCWALAYASPWYPTPP
ncbi:MAG TPA: DUF3604 domain-containing protein [Kineosporiaceae bacterium]|nr:DUF3604 domain-containing protein [Kineosporiaceae bacterium]